MHHIVKGVVSLPFDTTLPYKTHKDNMTKLSFEIVQGESAVASENQSLGRVKVRVQPEPKGQQRVLMNIRVDTGGKI